MPEKLFGLDSQPIKKKLAQYNDLILTSKDLTVLKLLNKKYKHARFNFLHL